jgi:hypothetical protein
MKKKAYKVDKARLITNSLLFGNPKGFGSKKLW